VNIPQGGLGLSIADVGDLPLAYRAKAIGSIGDGRSASGSPIPLHLIEPLLGLAIHVSDSRFYLGGTHLDIFRDILGKVLLPILRDKPLQRRDDHPHRFIRQ